MIKQGKKYEPNPFVEEDDDELEEAEEELDDELDKKSDRKFILVTKDFSGMGFAIQEIKKNGSEVTTAYKTDCEYDEKDQEGYDMQGEGLVEKMPLDELMKDRNEYRDWYFIWDGNHNPDENELLRSEGFKVFGGSQFTYDLENDREFGIKFAEECGLYSPEQQEFSNANDAIKFLEENEDKAYVFKPNGGDSHLTFVSATEEPHSANKEVREYIRALNPTDFILQERVKGVEVNVESFYVNGVPMFTKANLENKKLHDGDMGSACGCAFDVEWEIKQDCDLAQMTIRKFDQKLQEMNYTGFGDCNVIIGDYNNVYFIEFCFRSGYNDHPNFFFNLADKTMFQTCADMLEGKYDTKCKKGFGGSITVFNDHYECGMPIYIPETVEDNFYLFDGYMEDDMLKIGGFGKEIGIVMGHNYTIKSAMEEAEENARKVKFPNKYFRTDSHKNHGQNSLIKRYEALEAMDLI